MDPVYTQAATKEEIRIEQDKRLRALGLNPAAYTDEQRKTMPELAPIRDAFVEVPLSEKPSIDPEVSSINKQQVIREEVEKQRAIDIVNKSVTTENPVTLEEANVKAKKESLNSIPLYSTDPFVEEPVMVVSQEDMVLPLEAQAAMGIPANPLKRQVSSPGTRIITDAPYEYGKAPPTTPTRVLDHKALSKEVKDRANVTAVLRTRAELSKLYPDMTEEEQTQLLLNVSQKAITNAPDEKGVLSFAQEAKGQTPDVTDVQASKSDKPVWNEQEYQVYSILRVNLQDAFTDVYATFDGITKEEARVKAGPQINKAVDLEVGEEQWWFNPKEVEIYRNKEPEGLGIISHTYSDGSTVEGLPAFGARLISAPANYVAGAIGAGIAYGDSELQNQRETSRLGKAGGDAGVTNIYEAMHAGGKGNAVSNRGFSEELYDYTVSANKVEDRELRAAEDKAIADGTMTQEQVDALRKERADYYYYLELGAQGAGLVLDIVTPTVPGSGVLKGAGEAAISIAKAGKTTGKVGGSLMNVTGAALKEYGKSAIPFRTSDIAGATEEAVRKQTADIIDVAAYTQKSTNLEDIKGYAKGELGEAHPLVKRIDSMSMEEAKAYTKGMLDAVPEDLRKTLDAPLLSSKGYTEQVPRLLKDTIEGSPSVKKAIVTGTDRAQFVTKNMDNPYIRSQVEKTFRKQVGSEAGQRMFRQALRRDEALFPNLLPSKYTALTPNLYATNKRVADDILEAVGKTKVGILLKKLNNGAVELLEPTKIGKRDGGISGVQAEVKPYAQLTEQEANYLTTMVDQFATMYKGRQDLRTLLSEVHDSKRISKEDIRLLQDLHIEAVGRGQFPTKVSSPEQIAKFQDTYVYNELVKPVDIRRGFIVNTINKAVREIAAKFGVEGAALVKTDPRLLTILDETQQRAASIAKQLPIEIRDVKQSPEARAFYGLPTTGELTDKQVMVRLLTGKAKDEEVLDGLVQQIQDLVVIPKSSQTEWLERSFSVFGKNSNEGILHLTKEERVVRAAATKKLKDAIAQDPDRFAEHLSAYIEELSSLKANKSVSVLDTKTSTEDLLAALYLNRAANISNQQAMRSIANLEPQEAFREIAIVASALDSTPTEVYTMMMAKKLEDITGMRSTYPVFSAYPTFTELSVTQKQSVTDLGGVGKLDNARPLTLEAAISTRLDKQQQAFLDEAFSEKAHYSKKKYKLGDMSEDIDIYKHYWKDGMRYEVVDNTLSELAIGAPMPSKITGYQQVEEMLGSPKALENIASFMHSTQNTPWLLKVPGKLFRGLKEAQYTFMLTLRLRFHGANILTAPFIMYGNMGGTETVRSLSKLGKGSILAGMANDWWATKKAGIPSKALVIDKAGRQYSYEEVADMMRRGGLQQSQMTTFINPSDVQKIAESIDPSLLSKGVDVVKEFAATTDSTFRAAVLIQKLEDGLPPAQAIRQAREALFDYGRMTDAEKKSIGSWFAFYSFTRASSLNLLEQMATNPKRVKNSLRFSKGANIFGDDDTDREYSYKSEPIRLMAKPLLALYQGNDKESYAIYGPSIPMVDTIVKLVNFATFEESPLESANPLLKVIVPGTQDTMKQLASRGYIDPRLVARYEAFGMIPMLEKYLGVKLNTREARAGEPYYINDKGQRYTYTLADNNGAINENAVKQLTRLLTASSMLGTSTVLNDYTPAIVGISNALGVSDIEGKGTELNISPWEMGGFVTDARYTSPVEQQAFRRSLIDAEEKKELDRHNKLYKTDRK